mmetsp:Transcript_3937/g.12980  ORF Transcript_3937/g.12980 Transcript_3937/m.12980 type:complete len:220 (-) Transcript_3937:69-728(-)
MFAEVLAAHSPSNQPVGESSAAAASDAATLEASIRQEEARQAGEISEKYIMYEDRPNTRSDAERLAPDRLEATEELRDKATGGVAGGVGRVAQGEAAGRCPRRSARAVARGALLAGGAQGEGVHANRRHGRQHRHHPRGLSRGQGAVAQARATRVRGQASLLHAARGRDAHHRESHGAAGRLALLARPGRPCGPPAEERAREALLYWPTDALLARGVLQ